MIGNFGDISVYSLYPGKNLGAAGDAGIITTNNSDYNETLVSLRNYGSEKKYYYNKFGWNNRMDGIQAIVLNEKLKYLDDWNKKRSEIALFYSKYLSDIKEIDLPKNAKYCSKNVYHIYCIRVKDRVKLQDFLSKFDITTIIHYPVPIEITEIYKNINNTPNTNTIKWSNEILSLPIHPFMDENQVIFITEKIKQFYDKNITT